MVETFEVKFFYLVNMFSIIGEFYFENVMVFYVLLCVGLYDYLVQVLEQMLIEVYFLFKYFNSFSIKLLCLLILLFNDVVCVGKYIMVYWYYDFEDDMMMEFGYDLQDEFGMLYFNVMFFEVV